MQDAFVLAAKCAPEAKRLEAIRASGISAVELFLSGQIMADVRAVAGLCRKFPFRYALHAPRDEFSPDKLAILAQETGAEVVVFHDIYWEDEWARIAKAFKTVKAKPCVENISDADQPIKLMRRYGFGRCLDLEHVQMQCGGVYEEEFAALIRQASHIHLTGYSYGAETWHTHIYENPGHGKYFLRLIESCGYRGMVVSEARRELQTAAEFKKLKKFCDRCLLKKAG